jgi:hypothetical protein
LIIRDFAYLIGQGRGKNLRGSAKRHIAKIPVSLEIGSHFIGKKKKMKLTQYNQLPHGKLGFLHFNKAILCLCKHDTPRRKKERKKA